MVIETVLPLKYLQNFSPLRIQKTRIILCIALLAAIASNLSITTVPAADPSVFKDCMTDSPQDGNNVIGV